MTLQLIHLADHFKADREAVFKTLYRECFPGVSRMVIALGGNKADVEDIFQDSLILLYEKALAGRLEIQSSLSAYVVGIARNLWIRQRRSNHQIFELNPEIDIPDDFLVEPEPQRLRLFSLLATAGRKCMELLQAFYYEQRSAQQLAEDFGFNSSRSATVQKHKCLEKVRASVQKKQLTYEEVVE